VLCNVAQFRLCTHTLRFEIGCWQIHKQCDKCGFDVQNALVRRIQPRNLTFDVQNEKYVLFLCPCMEMCCLRRNLAEQFAFDFTGADRIYIGDTGAFYSDNISEDVKLFLLKQMMYK